MATPAISPEQRSILDTFKADLEAKCDEIIRLLRQRQGLPPDPPAAPSAPPLAAPPQTSPPAQKPCAQTTTPELPPQPIPTPVPAPAPARSYPPSPSVETIEEVEHKQVYKIPLRNVKQMRQKQKLDAAKKMLPTNEIPCFGKCFGWPPKSGGIYNCFSRDEEPDAWYTTMLNATDALPNRT